MTTQMPRLLAQFLTFGLHLTAAQMQLLWACLAPAQRQHLCYQTQRLLKRRPYSQAGDAETVRFLEALHPRAVLEAVEAAVQAGVVTRAAIVDIEERLLAEMTAAGEWR